MILRYQLTGGRLMRMADAAVIMPGDDPADALADAVVQAISTEVEIVVGGKTVHLAMLLDPGHWDDDWRERDIEDPYEFLAGLVEAREPV
jgi:hypothetical protein